MQAVHDQTRTHMPLMCQLSMQLRAQEGVAAAGVCEQLRALGINVKQTPLTSTRLDFEARKLPAEGMVRASVHYYNTEQVTLQPPAPC